MPKRMTNSPAYLWYPNDVLSSGRVEELTATEECWYRRALDRSWMDEGIPSDPERLAKRVGKKCTAKAAKMILDTFFVPHKKDVNKMVNPRQEKERRKLSEKLKQKSDAGKKGMAKRWKRDKQTGSDDNTVIIPLITEGITDDNISISISSSISKEEEKKEDPATQAETAKPKVVDPVSRRIWTEGIELLTESGMADTNARSLLGKLGKEYGRELLGECIAATQAANAINAHEYLIKTLQNRKNGLNGNYGSNKTQNGLNVGGLGNSESTNETLRRIGALPTNT